LVISHGRVSSISDFLDASVVETRSERRLKSLMQNQVSLVA
jgi:hypothetical protein